MKTTSDYLNQLQSDKAALVTNLNTKGVSANNDETFTSLVPKVLDIKSGSAAKITDAYYLFVDGTRLDALYELLEICIGVTNCYSMFENCVDLTSLDLSGFDASSVTNMNNMFYNCEGLINLNLSNFDTSKVTNMNAMFRNCSNLTSLNVSSFDTSKVTDMSYMFYGCSSLTSLDLSNFDTSKVANASSVFANMSQLEKLIINRQDVFKITSTNFLRNTLIANGTGYIYVPDNMVETYKSATYWGTYADQIKGISELPTGGA